MFQCYLVSGPISRRTLEHVNRPPILISGRGQTFYLREVQLKFPLSLWPKAIKTEDTDGITRKSIENDETAEQILDLISEGEIIRAEKLILSSVYGPLYEGDQELILAMKTQAFIELIKKRNKGDAEQCSAVSELGTLIADLASGMQNLTPKIKLKVEGALFLSYVTNIWSEEYAYLLKEDERTKVADLIKAIFAIYEAYEALKKAKEARIF